MLTEAEKINKIDKKSLTDFLKSLDIEVKTNTKARGHQGIYYKNRIDVSRSLDEQRAVQVLIHEFAHYIHSKIEPDIHINGGTLERIFNVKDSSLIKKELLRVTDFVDRNSRLITLKKFKKDVSDEIKKLHNQICCDYPDFQRSKKFKEFDKYIKKSNARYLLKYDRVQLISPFLRRKTVISIDNLDKDFFDMPRAFSAYIKLRSYQRKQARISRRINKLNKYYNRHTELFARFVEGIYMDSKITKSLACFSYNRFMELLEDGYYFEMKSLFELTQII